jgi:hypothetical protein
MGSRIYLPSEAEFIKAASRISQRSKPNSSKRVADTEIGF